MVTMPINIKDEKSSNVQTLIKDTWSGSINIRESTLLKNITRDTEGIS